MKIQTLETKNLCESALKGGCGECQTSCQSACKTSCGIANQQCENKDKYVYLPTEMPPIPAAFFIDFYRKQENYYDSPL